MSTPLLPGFPRCPRRSLQGGKYCALAALAVVLLAGAMPVTAGEAAPASSERTLTESATPDARGNGPKAAAAASESEAPAVRATAGAVAGKGNGTAWRPPPVPVPYTPELVDAEQAEKIADKWGVRLLSLRRTAAGYMMDFRFRVLDAKKALPLFDSRNKPYVLVERSQAKLPVPAAEKVGAFRTTNRGRNIVADKNYYLMFANPDRHVRPGDKVTILIGDFKVEGLTVN